MRVLCDLTKDEVEEFTVQNELVYAYRTLLLIYSAPNIIETIKSKMAEAIAKRDLIVDKIYSKYVFCITQGQVTYVNLEKAQLFVL